MSECLNTLHTVRYRWKLLIDFVIFVGCGQACAAMLKILQNNKLPISVEYELLP